MDAVRVYVGSDHAGFSLRKNLIERLRGQGREIVDLGPDSDAACDYPEFASAVANAVRGNPGSLGILACATGQGMAIAAGKVRGIRAVVPANVEAARLTRFDNNANVLCLGSRLLAERDAYAIVDTWLATSFAGGRHARRIAKVAAIETASSMMFVTESEWLRLRELGVPASLFARKPDASAGHGPEQPKVGNGLGWISLPATMTARLPEITDFAREVRRLPLKDLVLLVDDAAGSPAAVLALSFRPSSPRVHIVDGAEKETVALLPERLHLNSTFVLVVTRSGANATLTAAEHVLWSSILHRCGNDEEKAGRHFAAITTKGSAFVEVALGHHYRKTFLDEADVADGFGLLGFEGMVPAALLGQDTARLLARAEAMAQSCQAPRLEDNPGASLGVLLGGMAKHGRRKLTLLLSKSLQPLGSWIARLLATASHQVPSGLLTSHEDGLLPSYPPDRIFVQIQAEGDAAPVTDEQIEALHGAGQPYIQIVVASRHNLAAEIFRWQMATTVAGVVMGNHALPAAVESRA